MASTPQPEARKLVGIAPWADSLSKGVAALAIGLYACGFLIVSIHHSNYGFIGINPFRPRILAAGAWFFFFTSIPVSIAVRLKSLPWSEVAQSAYAVWVACLGSSVPLTYILFNLADYAPASSPRKFWWVWLIAILVSLGLVLFVAQSKKFSPAVSAVASVALVLFFATSAVKGLLVGHIFRLETVALWFYAVIVVTLVELKVRSNQNLLAGGQWSKPAVTLFVILLAFAQYYYPHLKASWGGGAPIPVTMGFTKDSAISPSKAVSVELIDEADEGFYILGQKDSSAIYIPRAAVAFVYFSDKISDSQLLRDGKPWEMSGQTGNAGNAGTDGTLH
ncbi:MAG TPA: hypothetical protein VE377_16685 [Candidatus Dormibacteraeota bacterium]|nr:hypothetical protein [Candidatus Dormibacteraeota bacterium]